MNGQEGVGNSSSHWGVISGAMLAAVAGYLLMTPGGRRISNSAIQLLDGFSFECARFCQAATRAQIAATDGWKALEATLDASRRPARQ